MSLAVVSATLSQKKLIFRYGGFLNMALMGYLGIRGDEVTEGGGGNNVMMNPFKLCFSPHMKKVIK